MQILASLSLTNQEASLISTVEIQENFLLEVVIINLRLPLITPGVVNTSIFSCLRERNYSPPPPLQLGCLLLTEATWSLIGG